MLIIMFRPAFLWILLILVIRTLPGQNPVQPPREPFPAHAHNDYSHEHPLLDALENNFRSIEADVYSKGDSLYVAHNRGDIGPGRTLRALYLEPLRHYFKEGGGNQFDSACPLILLIDIKDQGVPTYTLLDNILQEYREMLCSVSPEGYHPGRVMAVISGNRPVEYMQEQSQRLAFVDGRIKDLQEGYPPDLMPLISDNWTNHFTWTGKGKMPDRERVNLETFVNEAHDSGQLIRFWATPDIPGPARDAIWSELLEAGVDLINTDDLEGLRSFISGGKPTPGLK
jgi:hypothetical protein